MTGPVTAFRTAAALRCSGAVHRIDLDFMICRMDIEIDYVVGPASRVVTVADCDAVRSDLHERLAALGYEKSVVVAFTTDRRWAE